jgi:hypothetical protein
MRFYAERPVRAARQLLVDVLVLAWVALVVVVARAARDLVGRLHDPAAALSSAGATVRDAFGGAAHTAAELPLVGKELAQALDMGTGAGAALAQAGQEQAGIVATMAMGTGIAVIIVAAVPVVLVWLVVRVRYARAAASARTARARDVGLLALRALAHQPTRRLLAVSDDPAAAWRRDDTAVVRDLANLELRALGLRSARREARPHQPVSRSIG